MDTITNPFVEDEDLVHPADQQAVIRLWLRMLACTTLVESELRKQFRVQFDFTLPRFEILAQLDRRPGGMMLSELSKRLMVPAGNVTPIIDRLIADGLVTRTALEIDRRVQIVRLTIEGRRKFRRMAKKNGEMIAGISSGLTPGQVEALTALLSETKAAVSASTQKPEEPARRRQVET
ncbi:MarR family winged helix-turn-helix transcriptional regulator [Tianweitania populi]|uniref:Transcriptional regulator n=1 Tax=Tianweitania populi TaxID=1607949 RepID=A0A8J3DU36_9HYPH|nr:MarR family transcriptional regulator [Tianweitania populi]GHD20553.1 transcriptional regulator [Tianweitania populi]